MARNGNEIRNSNLIVSSTEALSLFLGRSNFITAVIAETTNCDSSSFRDIVTMIFSVRFLLSRLVSVSIAAS